MSTLTTDQLAVWLHRYHRCDSAIRQGVCLLNAGKYEQAAARFAAAANEDFEHPALAAYLAACFLGLGEPEKAARKFAECAALTGDRPAAHVRRALALRAAGQLPRALETLWDALREHPEEPELHFQMGVLLCELQRHEEAELRFAQAVSLRPGHTEALVNLALCCGVRSAPDAAARHLQAAQKQRPWDSRIGLLLAQAAQAVEQQGRTVRVRAQMPSGEVDDAQGVDALSRVIEADPDFVDAFLSQAADGMDREVFAVLLGTLQAALERQPEHAELHYHCGRVLERLGRPENAIEENERAVGINPKFVRSLVELGKLYGQTNRPSEAAVRLEQAVSAGGEYPDVYFLLGNTYRDQGRWNRAKSAYEKALSLNAGFEAARKALAELPA